MTWTFEMFPLQTQCACSMYEMYTDIDPINLSHKSHSCGYSKYSHSHSERLGMCLFQSTLRCFFFADWVIHKSLSIPDWQYNNWPNVPLNQFHFFGSLFQISIGTRVYYDRTHWKNPFCGASNNANVCQFWWISRKKRASLGLVKYNDPCVSYDKQLLQSSVKPLFHVCQLWKDLLSNFMEISQVDAQKAMDHFGKGYLCVWNMPFTGTISISNFNGISWDGKGFIPPRMPV